MVNFNILFHSSALLNISEYDKKSKLLVYSSYFDTLKQISYVSVCIEMKNINILPIYIQDKIQTLCKFHKCNENDVLEIIIEIGSNYNYNITYFAIINDNSTKTYNYQMDKESFFFNEDNMIVGTNGISITNTLPILKNEYKITDRFGIRPHPFKRTKCSFHSGLDFSARIGTPIFAMADGIVTFSGYKKDYGYHIVIKHENNLETLYAHMRYASLLKLGQSVYKGQLIGYVGATGYTTGPHLHLEVRHNGIRCNPELFFSFDKKILTKIHNMRQIFIKTYINRLSMKLFKCMNSRNKIKYNELRVTKRIIINMQKQNISNKIIKKPLNLNSNKSNLLKNKNKKLKSLPKKQIS